MPSIASLYARRCVEGLVRVVEQVPVRLAARAPLELNDSSVAMLVLWTLLRWERTFLLIALENMGVDMWVLTRDVDALLEQQKPEAAVPATSFPASLKDLDQYLKSLLDRAELESLALGHEYLGTEHVLLAIIAGADTRLSPVLSSHNITYQNVEHSVAELLKRVPLAEALEEPAGSAGTRSQREAVGVPRRFGTAVLMLLVTMYAVLFSAMELLGAAPTVFVVVAVLFTGVGLGQMLLYRGKHPRAASVWAGACLFPIEILAVLLHAVFFPAANSGRSDTIPLLVILLVLSFPLGAGFGYLAGGLTAGVFLLIERYKKHREDRSTA